MPKKTEEGFVRADSANIPRVDPIMLAEFFSRGDYLSPEMRNVKMARSSRVTYSDQAIGYPRLKREGTICHVIADVTPENRVRAKGYNVHCVVDEDKKEIVKAFCDDCAACLGGCKHTVAFVTWLHRHSEAPSSTSVECYWKKSELATVGDTRPLVANDMKSTTFLKIESQPRKNFAAGFLSEIQSKNSNALLVKQENEYSSLSLFHLVILYKRLGGQCNPDTFIQFCSATMKPDECRSMSIETKAQANSNLWFAMRWGRITASKVYEASKCETPNGTLVKSLLGAVKLKDTDAMARGRRLEGKVIGVVEKLYKSKATFIGLVTDKNLPIFGASPDALLKNFVVEVKCPISDESFKKYFSSNFMEPSARYKGQIMLQMRMCAKKVGLFCVADPRFEKTNKVKILQVQYDENFLQSMLTDASDFWSAILFPKMYHNV